jgi:hypothetical protein
MARVGVQSGLWTAMTSEGASSSFTNAELAEQTNIDPVLLSKTLSLCITINTILC